LFGPFRLHVAEKLFEKSGHLVKIGSRAVDILITQVERAPEVVTKHELVRQSSRASIDELDGVGC
jgi:DNA-binding winged helix-turn-helix (wHTH) protein